MFTIAVLLHFLVFIVFTSIPVPIITVTMFPSAPTHYENHFKTTTTMLSLLAVKSQIITAKVMPSLGCISAFVSATTATTIDLILISVVTTKISESLITATAKTTANVVDAAYAEMD